MSMQLCQCHIVWLYFMCHQCPNQSSGLVRFPAKSHQVLYQAQGSYVSCDLARSPNAKVTLAGRQDEVVTLSDTMTHQGETRRYDVTWCSKAPQHWTRWGALRRRKALAGLPKHEDQRPPRSASAASPRQDVHWLTWLTLIFFSTTAKGTLWNHEGVSLHVSGVRTALALRKTSPMDVPRRPFLEASPQSPLSVFFTSKII